MILWGLYDSCCMWSFVYLQLPLTQPCAHTSSEGCAQIEIIQKILFLCFSWSTFNVGSSPLAGRHSCRSDRSTQNTKKGKLNLFCPGFFGFSCGKLVIYSMRAISSISFFPFLNDTHQRRWMHTSQHPTSCYWLLPSDCIKRLGILHAEEICYCQVNHGKMWKNLDFFSNWS